MFVDDQIRVVAGELAADAGSYRVSAIVSVRIAMVRHNQAEIGIGLFALLVGSWLLIWTRWEQGATVCTFGAFCLLWAERWSRRTWDLVVNAAGSERVAGRYDERERAEKALAAVRAEMLTLARSGNRP